MSSQSGASTGIPFPLAFYCFLFGGALGWFAFFVTQRVFDRRIRPQYFPNLPSYRHPRARPAPSENQEEDIPVTDALIAERLRALNVI
jgi:hypothetical protein